jgi:sugar/nucleoside kinase (ribokinase family)
LSCRVGNDLFGREVRDQLAAAGIETSQIEASRTAPTSSTFVLNVQGEDRRFIHCVGANAEYDGSEIQDDAIRKAKVLYVGGFCLLESLTPERVIRLFRVAREAGSMTMLNVVLSETTDTTAWMEPVLPWTDYFFTNDDEAARITGQSDPIEQAQALRTMGVMTAVVTRGAKGAVLVSPDARLRSGVYPVRPVDSTGTGDAFAAGFLYGLLRGQSVDQCLKLGSAMGASCVRSVGATTGVFHANELEEFVRTQSMLIEAF